MRRFLLILLAVFAATGVRADPAGQRFVSIAFHDVVDDPADLSGDSVTTATLVRFFDWLRGYGWTAVSLDDLAAAKDGRRRLPDKAILLTFDDGYASFYRRVFPLLKAYNYPAVSALVGSWMEDSPDGKVAYGDQKIPRTSFISWAEAREIQASGLVEFASHTYDLHRTVQANPQGNQTPAAMTWRFEPSSQAYENDGQYIARLRNDLERSSAMMEARLGRRPRAVVWPYGRYTGLGLQVVKEAGYSFGLTLTSEPADTASLYAIPRFYPAGAPNFGDLVRNLRFEASRPQTVRIACLKLDTLAAAGDPAAQDEVLGRFIENLRALGANTVVIDAAPSSSPTAPLTEAYFSSSHLAMRSDILGRATWQIRTRMGADVFLRLPLAPAVAAVGSDQTPALFGEMLRYARPDGVMIDLPEPIEAGRAADTRTEVIAARRAALDPDGLGAGAKLALAAYRAAAAVDPHLRLMLSLESPSGPPDWADIALEPLSEQARETEALARRLRTEGWLRPDVSARVAFTLPSQTDRQVEALRRAQRLGASAFALCPQPVLPAPPSLAAAFSAASYPYRP